MFPNTKLNEQENEQKTEKLNKQIMKKNVYLNYPKKSKPKRKAIRPMNTINKAFDPSLGSPKRVKMTDEEITEWQNAKKMMTFDIIPVFRDKNIPPATEKKAVSNGNLFHAKRALLLTPKASLKKLKMLNNKNENKNVNKDENKDENKNPNKNSNKDENKELKIETERTEGSESFKEKYKGESVQEESFKEKKTNKKKKRGDNSIANLADSRSKHISIRSSKENSNCIIFTGEKDSFVCIRLIGRGGFSHVYEIRSLTSKKAYALKHIEVKDSTVMEPFEREIQLLETMKGNRSIIQLESFTIDHEWNEIFIVFEIAQGDMGDFVRRHSPMAFPHAIKLWTEMVRAVQVLHKNRIVHKDLKPENFVLVGGLVKLIDFGLAKKVPDYTIHDYNEKTEGTPSYMAPECFDSSSGKVAVCMGTDIWSLGIILFEMMSGKPPFHDRKVIPKCLAIINGDPIPFHLIKNPEVINIIKTCLNRKPRLRPTTDQILKLLECNF